MTTYKEIFGKYVKNYSSDPTADAEGQVWYNSTSGTFKSEVLAPAAWASGGNMTTARRILFGTGTQTAGLAAGGTVTSSGDSNATEEYNGSTWGPGGNLGTAKNKGGSAGTQTAGLVFGGYSNPAGFLTQTEEYDGSTWSPSGNIGTARYLAAGAGIQTAALMFSGYVPGSPSVTNATESILVYDELQ